MSVSIPNSLTLCEAAATLDLNVGQVLQLRANGGRCFDPTFPKMIHGQFIEVEVLAWKKSKDDKSSKSHSTPEGSQK